MQMMQSPVDEQADQQVTCRFILLTVLGVIVLVIVVLGGFFYWVFRDGLPDHAEIVLQNLEQDLQTIEAYYDEPISTRMYSSTKQAHQSMLA